MTNAIGDKITGLRIKAGLNQRELAKKLDIHESTLSNIESGRRLPSYELLAKIVEELNIDFNQVMGKENGGKGDDSPPKDIQMFLAEVLLEREIGKGDQILADYYNRFSSDPPKWLEPLKTLLMREINPFLENASVFIKEGDPRFNIFIIFWLNNKVAHSVCKNGMDDLRLIDETLDLWEFMTEDRGDQWNDFHFSIQNLRKTINIHSCHYHSLEIDNMIQRRFGLPTKEEKIRLDEILPKENIPDPFPTLRDMRFSPLHLDKGVES